MTRGRAPASKREKPALSGLVAWLQVAYRWGILGVVLVALALVTMIGLVWPEQGGFLIRWWSHFLRQMFGVGSYVVTVAIGGVGCLLFGGRVPDKEHVPWRAVIGLEIVFLSAISLLHLLLPFADPWAAAHEGRGGGYLGVAFSSILRDLIGPLPAGAVLSGVLAWGASLVAGLTWDDLPGLLSRWGEWRRILLARLRPTRPPAEAPEPCTPVSQPQVASAATDSPTTAPSPPRRARAPSGADRPRRRRRRVALPPIELLNPPDDSLSDEADLERRARVIEETLALFDVPARVVEINRGPMVTQFGVEPGYVTRRGHDGGETERKVRVSKIASLSDDLALALAAAPIRIEAPVPGRSIVGIEVPNEQVTIVPLRRVMSSTAFRRRKSGLTLALGEGVAGTPLVADLDRMPHLLIAGATGSGKSVCINAIATCLLFQNSPLTLRLVMIDPKRVEMIRYNGLPHLYGQVESDVKRVVGVLRWLVHEMQDRYLRLSKAGARHLDDYNRHWHPGSSEYMSRIVVLIDELADLMFFAPDEVERSICRLAQMARATGIHLVLATQRPSVDVVTGLIKANFPARIGFAVSSGVDSRVILDTVGAEALLGRGDMLYMSPEGRLTRAQGSFVAEEEIERVVQYWRNWATAEGWTPEPPPWESLTGEEEKDDLLRQAIELARRQGSASASMLQRRLRIGYPRAARLIDEMEKLGVIGPAEGGGRPRKVLDFEDNAERTEA